jgi:hypothetical protein
VFGEGIQSGQSKRYSRDSCMCLGFSKSAGIKDEVCRVQTFVYSSLDKTNHQIAQEVAVIS